MILEATASVEKEINPWLSAAARFDEAADRLGLDEGLAQSSAHARHGIDRQHPRAAG